ncbi:MAG: hypothetical protein HC880_02145, partial [Bacteroidia bacterium]|nr:hypothetical protein [Bacteroidia bacterium]
MSSLNFGGGSRVSPAFTDLDFDGDLDLAVGFNSVDINLVSFGTIRYFRNDNGTFTVLTGEANPFNNLVLPPS